jgi:replication factor A1
LFNRYTISLYATDATWELEFILFDDRAVSLIGKTADRLLKKNNRHDIPPEISALIGEKITAVVKIYPSKSIDREVLRETTMN